MVAERQQFLKHQASLDTSRCFFIDESGCHPDIGPRRGWAPVGKPLVGFEEPYSRGRHVSMIAALTTEGIATYKTVDGGVKTTHFKRFVIKQLIPLLRPGDIVCWDNINMHKNKGIVKAITNAGATVLQLPRYSPDLNPIEAAWAKVKSLIRKAVPTSLQELKRAMRASLRRIRIQDARGWIQYCGYTLPRF